jgi:isocitrate dehydrogenase
MALAVSLEHLGETFSNEKALIFSETLEKGTSTFLENKKSPSRKVNELDNRGSHFYLALYWAQALAEQNKDLGIKERFITLARLLESKEEEIIEELNSAQGDAVDIGGYYEPNPDLVRKAMRPSATLNELLDNY